MTELIVFDLDGTLSDSKTSIVLTFQEACRSHGVPPPSAACVEGLIGLPLDVMFPRALASSHPALDAGLNASLVADYKSKYIPFDRAHTRLFEGVMEMLSLLAGRSLAIATSKTQRGAVASLTRAGLLPFFDCVAGHDSVARPKPNPDMLQFVSQQTGVPPERMVMVGDTTYDLEMADAAGVRALGVAWGMHGAERLARWPVVQSVQELGALLVQGP